MPYMLLGCSTASCQWAGSTLGLISALPTPTACPDPQALLSALSTYLKSCLTLQACGVVKHGCGCTAAAVAHLDQGSMAHQLIQLLADSSTCTSLP